MKSFSNHLVSIVMIVCITAFVSGCGHSDPVVSARWVKKVILDWENFGEPHVIVHTSWGPAGESYTSGHIPGAIHVNTDELEYDEFLARSTTPPGMLGRSTTEAEDLAKGLSPDDTLPRNWWNIYPDRYLLPAIAFMGIDVDTTVVVYSPDVSAAARLVWILMYAGVEDVRLLDGGLDAWLAAGFEVETGLTERTPVGDFGTDRALHPEYLVDTAYIREVVEAPHSAHPSAVIADIRTWGEYTGATAPYSYIPTDGRIAGAVWGHAGSEHWLMDHYVKPDGTLRSPASVEAMWRPEGITAHRSVSFYCGTGWRAALSWLFAHRMGWNHTSLYDGGWYEWSMGPEAAINPMEDDEPGLP